LDQLMSLAHSSEALDPVTPDAARRLEAVRGRDEITPLRQGRRPLPVRLKWMLDRLLAPVLLVATLPLFAVVSAAIWLSDGGPPFYRQERVGYLGRVFRIWKFRTMHVDAHARVATLLPTNDGHGRLLFKLHHDPRVTRVGRVLRRFSIDELPQLINVLTGEMSLVGPRPLPGNDVNEYSPLARRRFEVKPGITGLWQVSGRSHLDWEATVATDLHYIDGWSLLLDLKILLLTLPAVARGSGAF
jgi:lipopolysaccharide/colanic/teichoic acid biosynthesis glycosyltransferase